MTFSANNLEGSIAFNLDAFLQHSAQPDAEHLCRIEDRSRCVPSECLQWLVAGTINYTRDMPTSNVECTFSVAEQRLNAAVRSTVSLYVLVTVVLRYYTRAAMSRPASLAIKRHKK